VTPLRARLRGYVYQAFYRLPGRWRRRIVRSIQPTYVVGSVILARDPDGARLLLLRQPPGAGWSLPAGLMDRGETPIQTAARELAEESGLRPPIEDFPPAVPNAVVHTKGRWIDMVFEVTADPEAPLTIDGGEVLEAGWHRLDNLPPLTVPTAQLLRVYGIGPYLDYPEATP